MILKTVWNVLMPGVCAGSAAVIAVFVTEDAATTAFAAAVGAVAGALLQERDDLPVLGDLPMRGGATPEAEASTAEDAAEALAEDVTALPIGYGRILLERMPLGIIVVTGARSVSFINPAGRALFGRVAEGPFEIETLRVPRLLDVVDEVRLTRAPAETDFVLQRRGTLHLTAHAVPLQGEESEADGAEPDVLIALEDRTQARQAEDLHRDFVANASHELKTPLAVLSGLIETLLGHGRDDPDAQARFLPMMAQQTKRMRHLVEDLLSLNRIELNERTRPSEAQPLARILGETVEALRPMAEAEHLSIRVAGLEEEAAAALRVAGVREELAQVFTNLVENAVKYGRPAKRGATVGAPSAPAEGARGEIRVMLLSGSGQRRGMVGVAVEDDGPGIAREHLPRLTERFYRVSVSRSRERGGTGLGLAIVKHIMNRHRGHLEIESTPGVGSRFTAWLPLL